MRHASWGNVTARRLRRLLPPLLLILSLVGILILVFVLTDANAEVVVGVLSGWFLATVGQIVISPRLEAAKRQRERQEAALRELVRERVPRADQALTELKIFWSWLSGESVFSSLPPEVSIPMIFKLDSASSPRQVSVPWPFVLEVKGWRLLLAEIGPSQTLRLYSRLYSSAAAIEALIYLLGIGPATQYVTLGEDKSDYVLPKGEARKFFTDTFKAHMQAAEQALAGVEKSAYEALGLSSWDELFPQRSHAYPRRT
jgi:hypothetical protein